MALEDFLNSLMNDLMSLKQILACPRLYLAQHFSELISQIDLAAVSLLNTKPEKPDKKQQAEINKIQASWNSMTSYVQAFQDECLYQFDGDFIQSTIDITEASINKIETKINDLEALKTENEYVMIEKAEEIDLLIYDNVYRLLRILFRDRSVFFLEKKLFDVYVDERIFFGKLCHVTDSYFGHKGVANIRGSNLGNDDLELQKHTSEFLKTFYFTKQKRAFLSNNQFCEVTLNCENEICMNLYNKNLSFVNGAIFQDFKNLTYIDMTCNSLSKLPSEVFQGLVNVTVLNLGGNLLESVAPATFSHLPKLTSLNIACNNLKSLEACVFQELPNLAYINLGFNHINSIEPGLFHNLPSLCEIVLTSNHITSISSNVFNGLNDLVRVNLSYNQIEAVDSFLFKGLYNLQCVNLSFNKFFIPPVEGASFFKDRNESCRFYLNEEKEPEICLSWEDVDK